MNREISFAIIERIREKATKLSLTRQDYRELEKSTIQDVLDDLVIFAEMIKDNCQKRQLYYAGDPVTAHVLCSKVFYVEASENKRGSKGVIFLELYPNRYEDIEQSSAYFQEALHAIYSAHFPTLRVPLIHVDRI